MTLSAFLSVIVLLAIGFVVLYILSIYLKYSKTFRDRLHYLHSVNIVFHSVKTKQVRSHRFPVLRQKRRSRG